MKSLIIVLFASGIFPVLSIRATAQTTSKGPSKPLKFIEGIEIKPAILNYSVPSDNAAQPGSAMLNSPSATESNFSTNSVSASHSIENTRSIQFKYAQLLNKEVESLNNLALFNFVEEWWGTRYRYGGTTKSGVDCSSFSGQLQSNVYGINLPRTAREQFRVCERIKRDNLKEGDLVFFNTRGGVSHVGVYISNGYFVHSSTRQGVTISSLDDEYYNDRFIGAGRISPEQACIETTQTACN